MACCGALLAACARGPAVQKTVSVPSPAVSSPKPSVSPAAVNVYASTMSGVVPARFAGLKPLVYVPNSQASSVDVVDPRTLKVVDHFGVGVVPHHVFPAWDGSTLYVGNTASNTLTQIDVRTHRPVRTINVPDPYNLYWPWVGGVKAMVIAERFNRIDFRDPVGFKLLKSVRIPWKGIDHGDFTADGRYWIGSTEFDGVVVKIDVVAMKLVGSIRVGGLPIDARLAPDGKTMLVANQGLHGVHVIDPVRMRQVSFIHTGLGAHGFQVSRDTSKMFVANRLAGTISVIDVKALRVVATWRVGGSPDMIQLDPSGSRLWASNRFNSSVSVIDTRTGKLVKVIRAGLQAHGLTFFPNAGERCTGHNGVYR